MSRPSRQNHPSRDDPILGNLDPFTWGRAQETSSPQPSPAEREMSHSLLRSVPTKPVESFSETASIYLPSLPIDAQSKSLSWNKWKSIAPATRQVSESQRNGFEIIEAPPQGRSRRTRVNRKKIEKGNNHYGRSGNLRCWPCRKRRGKCVFVSEALPCDFCQSRNISDPCIKLGPPKVSPQRPSRPLATIIEGSIESKDTQVLQYAYSQACTLMASFVKQMALTFGMSIGPIALRHATLAYAISLSPHNVASQPDIEFHIAVASSELLKRVRNPCLTADADAFAAMILAWVTRSRGMVRESLVHASGGIALLNHLLPMGPSTHSSNLLDVFAPLLRDNFNTVLAASSVLDSSSADSLPSSFVDRIGYFERLCHTGSPPEAWRTTELETTCNYLRGSVYSALLAFKDITFLELSSSNGTARINAIQNIIDYIRLKIEDYGFRTTFSLLEGSTGSSLSNDSANRQLVQYLSTAVYSLDLLKNLFISPPLLQGIESEGARLAGRKVLLTARLAGPPLKELKYYRDVYFVNICIGGLILHIPQDAHDIYWIQQAVNSEDLHKTTSALNSWWQMRTLDTLRDFSIALDEDWAKISEKWH